MYFSRREDPISSPKTQARAQLGSKIDRATGRVAENPSASVTIDQLMRYAQFCRASGSDREECERCEGRCPHPTPEPLGENSPTFDYKI